MSRRFKTKGRVGVGQDPSYQVSYGDLVDAGYADPSVLANAQTGRGIVPNMGTGPVGNPYGVVGGNPNGGPLEVPIGKDPYEAAQELQNLKFGQEQALSSQSASQRSSEQSQSFSQQQALKNQEFNQRMAEIQAQQANQDNPFAGLAPRYAAPNAIQGPNGAVSMFDPGTGQLVPVFQPSQDIRISGGNLIVPPGQQAQVYYAGNKGQPTNVSGGPGQVNYPQQLPFSALQQAQAVAPMIQQYAQQQKAQAGGGYGGGMSGAAGGAGGFGGGGNLGGAGSNMGGFGRAFGQQQGLSPYGQVGSQMGSQFGRTFGGMMPQVPSQPQIPPQAPQQPSWDPTAMGNQWLDQILGNEGG